MSFNFLKQSSSANGTVKFYPTHTEIPWLVIIYNAEAKIENHLIRKRSVMNQFNIEVDWPNSLVHSLHSSRALNLTVDRFQTNDTLIYSHGLSTIAVCEQSLFFFRFREGSARARAAKRETGKTRAAARDLPSRTFSHASGHLSVSRVLLDGLRQERDCS